MGWRLGGEGTADRAGAGQPVAYAGGVGVGRQSPEGVEAAAMQVVGVRLGRRQLRTVREVGGPVGRQ